MVHLICFWKLNDGRFQVVVKELHVVLTGHQIRILFFPIIERGEAKLVPIGAACKLQSFIYTTKNLNMFITNCNHAIKSVSILLPLPAQAEQFVAPVNLGKTSNSFIICWKDNKYFFYVSRRNHKKIRLHDGVHTDSITFVRKKNYS